MELNGVLINLLDDQDIIDIFESSSDEETMVNAMLMKCHKKIKRTTIKNYCSKVVPTYSVKTFFSHFRLKRVLVEDIAQKFASSDIYTALIQADNSKKCISAEKHILTFLWYSGHQTVSFRDVADRFDLSLSSVYEIITRVSHFLSSLATTVIKLPTDEEKRETINYYQNKTGFPNIIGCIDGTHIKTDKPADRHVDYFNRKDYYSIHMQGLCNENLKFLDIFIGYPGSVHDARVFKNSHLFELLPSVCDNSHILGDSAYPLSKWIMTPYKDNGHLTYAQKYFNRTLSSCRVSIEHAFGVLKQRFRQLYHLKLKGATRICHFIRACCVLHNLAHLDDLPYLDNTYVDYQPNQLDEEVGRNAGHDKRNEICNALYTNRCR